MPQRTNNFANKKQKTASQPQNLPSTNTSSTSVSQLGSITNEELLFEYEELRKEILQNDNLSLQILNLVVLITGGIVGFSFSQTFDDNLKSILFLFAAVICLIGLLLNVDRLRSTNVIASYIKTCIEPQIHVRWETRLAKFRSIALGNYGMELISSQRIVYAILVLGNCVFGVYFAKGADFSKWTLGLNDIPIGVALVLLVSVLVYQWIQYSVANSTQLKQFCETWQVIRSEE